MLLNSDSISWRNILQNSHNSQMQWLVVSTLCQEMKKHLDRKIGSEGTPKLGPYWKLQFVACKEIWSWRSGILSLWTMTNSHSWVRISHGVNKLVTNLKNNEQETKENAEKCTSNSHGSCELYSQLSSWVIGYVWDQDQKRNGTEFILISLIEFETKLLRKWWLNSQKPPIRFFALPAPLKEENYEAKEAARKLSTSTFENKTSIWTCALSFLQINSVGTEQQQIHARRYPKIPWLHGNQGNQKHMSFWRQWKFLSNFLWPTLGPMNSDGETCCKNTSNNSNNYLMTRSCTKYAPTLLWNSWCRRTKRNGTSMQRIHAAS